MTHRPAGTPQRGRGPRRGAICDEGASSGAEAIQPWRRASTLPGARERVPRGAQSADWRLDGSGTPRHVGHCCHFVKLSTLRPCRRQGPLHTPATRQKGRNNVQGDVHGQQQAWHAPRATPPSTQASTHRSLQRREGGEQHLLCALKG
jgi:hypothetical protein